MITNLSKFPQKRAETLQLIEEGFSYSQDNSFEVDFYPLMKKSNAKNCHILLEENTLVGHIGVSIKKIEINQKEYAVPMLGGIVISKLYRGKGLLNSFIEHVLALYKDAPFFLLWSDKLDLYERYSFFPCIEQYEYTGGVESDNPEFIRLKLNELETKELEQLKSIYDSSTELRYKRSIEDWEQLRNITSSDLYIKKENEVITNYFFMNKGEDLSGIIYEYGDIKDIEEISTYGILWSPQDLEVMEEEDKSLLFAALLRVGDYKLFSSFIHDISDKRIEVKSVTDSLIEFHFEESHFKMSHSDFLVGTLGPGRFSELSDLSKIYISGLDSI